MPGTRTAPTIDGSPIEVRLSIRIVDHKGERRSVSLTGPNASMTSTNIEAVVAAVQALSNGSVYEVEVSNKYAGVVSLANTLEGPYLSADDMVHLGIKPDNGTSLSKGFDVRAPLEVLVLNGEEVDTTNTDLIALNTAIRAALNDAWTVRTATFSEHSDRNSKKLF